MSKREGDLQKATVGERRLRKVPACCFHVYICHNSTKLSFNCKTNQINPLPAAAPVSSVLWTNFHLPCSPPRLFCRSDFRTQQYGDISLWGTGAGARGGVVILLNLLNQQVNKSMRPMTLSSPVLIRWVRNTDTIIHLTYSKSSSSPPTSHGMV